MNWYLCVEIIFDSGQPHMGSMTPLYADYL